MPDLGAVAMSRPFFSSDITNKSTDALEIEALVAAARAGSPSAFAELSHIFAPRLLRRILSITKNHDDAEDALQDTFLRAFRAIRSFRSQSAFYTWITRIAINSALMVLRRRRRLSEWPIESPDVNSSFAYSLDFEDPALNPEQMQSLRQMEGQVVSYIGRLRPELRAALEMKLQHNSSVGEIAQSLCISKAAVKSRLHRARQCWRTSVARAKLL